MAFRTHQQKDGQYLVQSVLVSLEPVVLVNDKDGLDSGLKLIF